LLYDKTVQIPEPGSLLESVLLLIVLKRNEAELYRTEALVTAAAAAHTGQYELISKTFRNYKSALLPFLETEKKRTDDEVKKALDDWTKNVAFKVRPLWLAPKESKRLHSKLRKSAARVKEMEEERRRKRFTRI